MSVKRLSNIKIQYDDGNGALASNYRLFFYASGSSSKQNTYNSSSGSVANSNPIVLNALGEPAVEIWLTEGLSYKVGLAIPGTDDPPASFVWTEDNVSGVNDSTTSVDQWKASGLTPTFVSATSFTLSGDQTTTFDIGRRLKTTNTAGTVYSTITASAFGALTTITVVNDSGVLDSGLSAVSYGLLSTNNPSFPVLKDTGLVVSGSTTQTKKARLEVDTYVPASTTRVLTVPAVDVTVNVLRGYIAGLTYGNGDGAGAGDLVNDITIAVGEAADSTTLYLLRLSSAITKQLDAAWAVGTAAGGLDTGAIGNSDYYIWLIARSDTGVIDVLFSLSSTAPTMPASYDFKRLIGWFKRVAGTIVAFHTYEVGGGELQFAWDAPTADITLLNTLTTARRTDAVKVPLNFSVLADLTAEADDAGEGFARIQCPDTTDAAIGAGTANLPVHTAALGRGYQITVRTSATGTIASRASIATVDGYTVVTDGFTWGRRN